MNHREILFAVVIGVVVTLLSQYLYNKFQLWRLIGDEHTFYNP